MARSKQETISVDGKKYYTSNYFASRTTTTPENARRFLSDYSHSKNSKNPKLYTWSTMQQAITAYVSKHPNMYSEEVLEDMREKRRAENEKELLQTEEGEKEIESKRAQIEGGIEEDSTLAYLNRNIDNPESSAVNSVKDSHDIKSEIRSRINDEFPKIALQHLLAVNGYTFDFNQYEKDLYTDISHELYREPGQPRSKTQRAARKRLASNNSYLLEIDKDC